MIKNLTQIFVAGILSGIGMSACAIALSIRLWGYHTLWAIFLCVISFITGWFHEKLRRCQQ